MVRDLAQCFGSPKFTCQRQLLTRVTHNFGSPDHRPGFTSLAKPRQSTKNKRRNNKKHIKQIKHRQNTTTTTTKTGSVPVSGCHAGRGHSVSRLASSREFFAALASRVPGLIRRSPPMDLPLSGYLDPRTTYLKGKSLHFGAITHV